MSKTLSQPKLEKWRRLDPIFIMGRQRTGTSIIWRALQTAGFFGFPEGHLWFDLVEAFARWRDPAYQENTRQDIFTLGSERNLVLEKRFALMLDQFHRDLLPQNLVRWVDKSPGSQPVRLAPMLAEIFPRSQFIFMLRNPITTADSAVQYVARNPRFSQTTNSVSKEPLHVFVGTCRHWVRVMKFWRQVRPLLTGRYIEVAQEDIVEIPDKVAKRLAGFLSIQQSAPAIANVFQSRRENTAFPDKSVDDFIYPVNWTDEQKAILTEICQDEMAIWRYPLDFQHPGGPGSAPALGLELEPMGKATYYQWLESHNELVLELKAHQELLARIKQGRMMRALNALERLLRRLRMKPVIDDRSQ